jgi:hypothetical protein
MTHECKIETDVKAKCIHVDSDALSLAQTVRLRDRLTAAIGLYTSRAIAEGTLTRGELG